MPRAQRIAGHPGQGLRSRRMRADRLAGVGSPACAGSIAKPGQAAKDAGTPSTHRARWSTDPRPGSGECGNHSPMAKRLRGEIVRIRSFAAAAAVLTICVAPVSAAAAGQANGTKGAFTLAVFGDEPYGTVQGGHAQFDATPAFIDSMNADPDVG